MRLLRATMEVNRNRVLYSDELSPLFLRFELPGQTQELAYDKKSLQKGRISVLQKTIVLLSYLSRYFVITDFRFCFPFAATVLSPKQEALGSLANTEFLAKMKSLEENVTYLHQTLVRDLVVRYKGKFGLKKMHNFRQE